MSPAIQIPIRVPDTPHAPPPASAAAAAAPGKPKRQCKLPKPLLRLELRDLSHAGTRAFLSSTDAIELLTNALSHVFTHLYDAPDSHVQHDASTGLHARSPVPQTRSVTLVLRSMGGVAYTTGLEIDDQHKEIHLSLEYVEKIPVARRKAEIQGVITHEMVHCLQWNGIGTAPGGLIEGVADWVRLRCRLGPPHWKREAKDKWDAGYQTTGYFLDWLEGKFGEGFVGAVNENLRERKYEDRRFWGELCRHKGVDELWGEYKEWLDKKKDDDKGNDGTHKKHDVEEKAGTDEGNKKSRVGDSESISSAEDAIIVEKEDAMNHSQGSDTGDTGSAEDAITTYEEKQEIAQGLPRLPKNRLAEALRIIQDGMHRRMIISGKIRVDIDELSEEVLQDLLDLIRSENGST